MHKIILASGSPRRAELLAQIGLEFEVIPSLAQEAAFSPPDSPGEYAARLARVKAEEIRERLQKEGRDLGESILLGADTVVFAEGELLGKPADEEDAYRMLRILSGRTHTVYTGVSLIFPGSPEQNESWYEECKVRMEEIEESEIGAYILGKEPMDKAGAYGIQGKAARFIRSLEGDYYTVMGLPLCALWKRIKRYC
ncbi:MAG: Maf family protein [Johnsonella sp.]|nr:Maf family protein [Johnsonella sp.]